MIENPHNIEAEQEIIGAIILENNLLHEIFLSAEEFYSKRHQDIYKAMLELNADGLPIDLILLSEKLNEEDCITYLSQIIHGMVTTANIHYHADIVKECAYKREFRKILINLQDNFDRPIDDLLTDLRNSTAKLIRRRSGELVNMPDMAKDLHEFLLRRSKNKNSLSGIPSGFRDLDELTDGFQDGDLIVIAGRPSSGKSAFTMSIAQNAGIPVGVVSIEMGQHQISIRTLAVLSKIELWRLRKGILSYEHWGDIESALNKMAGLPIYFSFTSKNAIDIERTITQMVGIYNCKLIIVDYLQLMKSNEYKHREQEVAEISRLLKIKAQSHSIPIIAISQLNREVERRENKRPILSDLRESGAIEQDADVVIFLYREETKSDGAVEVIIAKGRNIGLGTVKLYFHGDTMTFRDLIEETM